MSWWGDPVFSDVLAAGYIGLLLLLWSALVAGVPRWGSGWRVAPPAEPEGRTPPPEPVPWLTICIPARNEGHNIGRCVQAALASRWPALEVIVVDDRSTDDTASRAREAGAGDPRLHVFAGSEPQPGWAGKPWACARAASEARGSLLLFVDADVVLHPDAARALVAQLQKEDLALLSVFGTWELVTFWERAVIPAVGWLIRGATDLDRVNEPGLPEAFANGQLILVRREPYEAVGGHAAVANQILDDVRLAEAFKRRGHRLGMRVAEWAFSARLYRSLGEITRGYAKNLYEGMGRKPLIGLGAALFILVGTLVPFFALILGLYARLVAGWGFPAWRWLVGLALVCALQLAFRWRVDRRDGRSGRDAWTHPLANAVLVWILLRSVFAVKVEWKGRQFVDGRAGP